MDGVGGPVVEADAQEADEAADEHERRVRREADEFGGEGEEALGLEAMGVGEGFGEVGDVVVGGGHGEAAELEGPAEGDGRHGDGDEQGQEPEESWPGSQACTPSRLRPVRDRFAPTGSPA